MTTERPKWRPFVAGQIGNLERDCDNLLSSSEPFNPEPHIIYYACDYFLTLPMPTTCRGCHHYANSQGKERKFTSPKETGERESER